MNNIINFINKIKYFISKITKYIIYIILYNLEGFIKFLQNRKIITTAIGILIGTQISNIASSLMDHIIKPLTELFSIIFIKILTLNKASVSIFNVKIDIIEFFISISKVILTIIGIYLIWKFSTTETSDVHVFVNRNIKDYEDT